MAAAAARRRGIGLLPLPNECASCLVLQLVECLGILLFQALDFGSQEEEERRLGADLERLIEHMTSTGEWPGGAGPPNRPQRCCSGCSADGLAFSERSARARSACIRREFVCTKRKILQLRSCWKIRTKW